jgi:hypothetical protein
VRHASLCVLACDGQWRRHCGGCGVMQRRAARAESRMLQEAVASGVSASRIKFCPKLSRSENFARCVCVGVCVCVCVGVCVRGRVRVRCLSSWV